MAAARMSLPGFRPTEAPGRCPRGLALARRAFGGALDARPSAPTTRKHSRARKQVGKARAAEKADYPKWVQRNQRILDRVIEDIEEYLQEANDDSSKGACEALYWLKEKKAALTQSCLLEGGRGSKDCEYLDRLGRLVEDLESCSGVEDLVHILLCQCHAERGIHTATTALCEPLPTSSLPNNAIPTKDELITIFEHMDHNGDGKLDMIEFRDAMTTLGDPLSANSVQIIAQAFDIHGSVDKEQFMQIVSAEEIQVHTKDSEVLRKLARSLRNNVDHTPDWGS